MCQSPVGCCGRSPDRATCSTEGLPFGGAASEEGDLRSDVSAGSGDPRRTEKRNNKVVLEREEIDEPEEDEVPFEADEEEEEAVTSSAEDESEGEEEEEEEDAFSEADYEAESA